MKICVLEYNLISIFMRKPMKSSLFKCFLFVCSLSIFGLMSCDNGNEPKQPENSYTMEVKKGTVLTKEILKNLTVEGYDFIGWKLDNEFVFPGYEVKEDCTLKAELGKQLVIDGKAYAYTSEAFVQGKTFTGTSNTDESGKEINYVGSFPAGESITIDSYYISRFEVTQELYAAVMEGVMIYNDGAEEDPQSVVAEPSWCVEKYKDVFGLENFGIQKYRPVDEVTWYDAILFCNELSKKAGLTPAYELEIKSVVTWYDPANPYDNGTPGYHIEAGTVTEVAGANGYRLPYETEWEFAARGADPERKEWNYLFAGSPCQEGIVYDYYANKGMDGYGWHAYNNIDGVTTEINKTSDGENNLPEGMGSHQVGLLKPNSIGIFDMSGNVAEWCYEEALKKDSKDPTKMVSTGKRVERGGAWYFGANYCAVCNRGMSGPAGYRYNDLGIRLVRTSSK